MSSCKKSSTGDDNDTSIIEKVVESLENALVDICDARKKAKKPRRSSRKSANYECLEKELAESRLEIARLTELNENLIYLTEELLTCDEDGECDNEPDACDQPPKIQLPQCFPTQNCNECSEPNTDASEDEYCAPLYDPPPGIPQITVTDYSDQTTGPYESAMSECEPKNSPGCYDGYNQANSNYQYQQPSECCPRSNQRQITSKQCEDPRYKNQSEEQQYDNARITNRINKYYKKGIGERKMCFDMDEDTEEEGEEEGEEAVWDIYQTCDREAESYSDPYIDN